MIPPIMRIRTRYSGETVEKLFKIPVEDHTVTNVSIFERFKCTVQYFYFFFVFHTMACPPLTKFKISPQKYLMEKIKESLLGSSRYQ